MTEPGDPPAPVVAVFTGSSDPPGLYHRAAAEVLARTYPEVVVAPCLAYADGPPDIAPQHRATMADLAFRGIPNVRVDLSDLEAGRPFDFAALDARYAAHGKAVTHVVAAGQVRGGAYGQSKLQLRSHGVELWNRLHYTVLVDRFDPIDAADLPPHNRVLEVPPGLSSATIRSMLFEGHGAADHMPPAVYAYALRHGLYGSGSGRKPTAFRPGGTRFKIFADEWNAKSKEYREVLRKYESDDPELIVAIGGDGTMLRAIREHWQERVPFYGINTGGLGFLLNGRDLNAFWDRELLLYQLPLLWVEAEDVHGKVTMHHAFNDTWVERAGGQTAWVRVTVNGQERVPRMVGDGVLVATAAGSSSYARAMGASPVPLNADVLVLCGSNVLKPAFWRPAMLPMDSVIEIENIDPVRRPLKGCIDGQGLDALVRKIRIRASQTACVELAFTPEHDPVAKLGFVQFPKTTDD